MQLRHKRPDHTAHERTEEAQNSTADALDTWITELAAALGVDATTIDHKQILELSRTTHRVARAAAPFTLLLTGMAAGQNGGGAEAVNQAVTTAQRLARHHRRGLATVRWTVEQNLGRQPGGDLGKCLDANGLSASGQARHSGQDATQGGSQTPRRSKPSRHQRLIYGPP